MLAREQANGGSRRGVSLPDDGGKDHKSDDGKGMIILLIIVVPLVILAGIAVFFAVWSWTGPLIAFLALAGMCTAGASVGAALQRRNRLS